MSLWYLKLHALSLSKFKLRVALGLNARGWHELPHSKTSLSLIHGQTAVLSEYVLPLNVAWENCFLPYYKESGEVEAVNYP